MDVPKTMVQERRLSVLLAMDAEGLAKQIGN